MNVDCHGVHVLITENRSVLTPLKRREKLGERRPSPSVVTVVPIATQTSGGLPIPLVDKIERNLDVVEGMTEAEVLKQLLYFAHVEHSKQFDNEKALEFKSEIVKDTELFINALQGKVPVLAKEIDQLLLQYKKGDLP